MLLGGVRSAGHRGPAQPPFFRQFTHCNRWPQGIYRNGDSPLFARGGWDCRDENILRDGDILLFQNAATRMGAIGWAVCQGAKLGRTETTERTTATTAVLTPRTRRVAPVGRVFHVLRRGLGSSKIFSLRPGLLIGVVLIVC